MTDVYYSRYISIVEGDGGKVEEFWKFVRNKTSTMSFLPHSFYVPGDWEWRTDSRLAR